LECQVCSRIWKEINQNIISDFLKFVFILLDIGPAPRNILLDPLNFCPTYIFYHKTYTITNSMKKNSFVWHIIYREVLCSTLSILSSGLCGIGYFSLQHWSSFKHVKYCWYPKPDLIIHNLNLLYMSYDKKCRSGKNSEGPTEYSWVLDLCPALNLALHVV
jgi:hypothetical protein